jgi:hypothetical protein
MDRVSYLRQKAYRGALNLQEMQELVSLLSNMPAEIKDEIKRNLRQFKLYYESLFDKKFLNDNGISLESAKILEPLREHISQQTAKASKAVVDMIRHGVKAGATNEEIARPLIRKLNVFKKNAETLANTGRLSLIRNDAVNKSLEAGAKFFKYMGPASGIRSFCSDHLGKVFSIEEIRQMDNGQGLPVESYCGGYNCRHRWVATVARSLAFELQGRTLEYSKKDIDQDASDHGRKEFGLSREKYISEAQNTVKDAEQIFEQNYKGVDQYVYINSDGKSYAVASLKGEIKSYLKINEPVEEFINKKQMSKKQWIKLQK